MNRGGRSGFGIRLCRNWLLHSIIALIACGQYGHEQIAHGNNLDDLNWEWNESQEVPAESDHHENESENDKEDPEYGYAFTNFHFPIDRESIMSSQSGRSQFHPEILTTPPEIHLC
jgi:hypothetical protein